MKSTKKPVKVVVKKIIVKAKPRKETFSEKFEKVKDKVFGLKN